LKFLLKLGEDHRDVQPSAESDEGLTHQSQQESPNRLQQQLWSVPGGSSPSLHHHVMLSVGCGVQ